MGSLWKALFNQKYSAEYHQGVYVICLNRWIDCITEQVYIYIKKTMGKSTVAGNYTFFSFISL